MRRGCINSQYTRMSPFPKALRKFSAVLRRLQLERRQVKLVQCTTPRLSSLALLRSDMDAIRIETVVLSRDETSASRKTKGTHIAPEDQFAKGGPGSVSAYDRKVRLRRLLLDFLLLLSFAFPLLLRRRGRE